MKKNSFMQGAVVATLSIVISKVIGILYVILLYPMLGEKGGALYGYAYAIYSLFLGISIAGIPFAVSKITSEYEALGYIYTKEKAFKIGKLFISLLGIVSFLLMYIFAEKIGYYFIGDIKGGNTVEDVAFVVRIISSALLIVPVLSVSRGYLQGHKYIATSSFSQVVEQITRVALLLIGTYLALNVFKIGLTNSIGVSVFAATFGAICAYIFLYLKIKKEHLTNEKYMIKQEERKISTKSIINKIVIYAVPFILIDSIKSLFNFVDLSSINKVMVSLGYTLSEAESVASILSTWGGKLEAIVYAISTGLIVSMIPHITTSFALGNKDDIKNKVNTSIQALLFVLIPLVVMLSMLTTPIWTVFYGQNELANTVFRVFILGTIFVALYNLTCSILNCISQSKIVILSIGVGLILKIIFNAPIMNAMHFVGLHPSYGVTIASIIAFTVASLINFYHIKNKVGIDYKETFSKIINIIFGTSIMILAILLLQFIIPLNNHSRIISLLVAGFYGIIGSIIYLFVMIKNQTLYDIFGKNIFDKIKLKKRV